MRHYRLLPISLLVLVLVLTIRSTALAGSEPVRTVEAGWTTLNNSLGAIYFDRNIKDHYRYFRFHLGQYIDLNPGSSFVWQLEFENRLFRAWGWSDLVIPGLHLRWSRKTGIGPRAARISAWLRAQYLDYSADGCNGPLLTGGLLWNKRLAPRFRLGLGLDFDRRRTTHGTAYDLDGQTVHLTGSWEISRRLEASVTAGRRKGDVSIHDLKNWSPAGIRWFPSTLMGIPQRVYTIPDIDTDFLSVELVYHHSVNTSTRLNWRRDQAKSTWQDYKRDQVELGVIHRF